MLAKPSGVSVDSTGNIYIADTDNHRVRQVSGGTLGTVAGGSQQGFGGEDGAAISAILNAPRAVASDTSGNLTIADTLNQRLRTVSIPTLTFANDGVGTLSATQSVTLANTGSAAIIVASLTFTGAFTTATGGSCGGMPITLAAGETCTQNIAFLPIAPGPAIGSVIFGGTGVVPQSILLTGTGVQTATEVTLASNIAAPLAGQAILFTATVQPTGGGMPTGSVTFLDGTTPIGVAGLTASSASLSTTLTGGPHTITAVYAVRAGFTGSTSAVLTQSVLDFNLTLGTTTSNSQTVIPGGVATYIFNLLPQAGSFPLPVTFSATGLPPGATVTFPRRQGRSLTLMASLHKLAAASTTGSQTVSPCEYSTQAGCGHNCRTVQTMCKIPFASAPVSCCASRIKDCEALEPAAASPADIGPKCCTFQGIRTVISAY